MSRPECKKNIGGKPSFKYFISTNSIDFKEDNIVNLKLEEYEALKLCCYQNKCMKDGAKKMGISASTFYRLKTRAQRKVCEALITGKSLQIGEKN